MQTENKTKQVIATLAVLVVLVVIVFGAKSLASTTSNTTTQTAAITPATQSTATSGSASSSTSSATYKDGTYSADGGFNTPGGYQSIGVKVTIQSDTVTAATVTDQTTDGQSSAYAQMFIDAYRSYVVGKKVDNVHLYAVSGASLTSIGFNNALSQIKSKAQV